MKLRLCFWCMKKDWIDARGKRICQSCKRFKDKEEEMEERQKHLKK